MSSSQKSQWTEESTLTKRQLKWSLYRINNVSVTNGRKLSHFNWRYQQSALAITEKLLISPA